MKITHRNANYNAPYARESHAKFLCCILDGREEHGMPYKPNEGDDYYWSINAHNDYWVKFDEERPAVFELTCRYHKSGVDVLRGMFAHLHARWGYQELFEVAPENLELHNRAEHLSKLSRRLHNLNFDTGRSGWMAMDSSLMHHVLMLNKDAVGRDEVGRLHSEPYADGNALYLVAGDGGMKAHLLRLYLGDAWAIPEITEAQDRVDYARLRLKRHNIHYTWSGSGGAPLTLEEIEERIQQLEDAEPTTVAVV